MDWNGLQWTLLYATICHTKDVDKMSVQYSEEVHIRCDPETVELIQRAAFKRGMKPAEYMRGAFRTALALDGFTDPWTDLPVKAA